VPCVEIDEDSSSRSEAKRGPCTQRTSALHSEFDQNVAHHEELFVVHGIVLLRRLHLS